MSYIFLLVFEPKSPSVINTVCVLYQNGSGEPPKISRLAAFESNLKVEIEVKVAALRQREREPCTGAAVVRRRSRRLHF